MLLGLKQVFHLPLRAVQGFAHSLRKLAYPGLPVPNYTTLSRRAQTLKVVLPSQCPNAPLHLVIDSTGLKVYGEGEWKVRKHGWSKRRTWRQVHLAMDANTGQICAALMTHQDEGDGEVVIDTIGGDGAYDTKPCRAWRDPIDSAARRSEAVARSHTRRRLAQRSYRRDREQQQTRMEADDWLSPTLARRDLDVPTEGTYGSLSVGARDWLAGH